MKYGLADPTVNVEYASASFASPAVACTQII
jgi:hypothetical protein